MNTFPKQKAEAKLFADIAFVLADLMIYTQTHDRVNAAKWQLKISRLILRRQKKLLDTCGYCHKRAINYASCLEHSQRQKRRI